MAADVWRPTCVRRLFALDYPFLIFFNLFNCFFRSFALFHKLSDWAMLPPSQMALFYRGICWCQNDKFSMTFQIVEKYWIFEFQVSGLKKCFLAISRNKTRAFQIVFSFILDFSVCVDFTFLIDLIPI